MRSAATASVPPPDRAYPRRLSVRAILTAMILGAVAVTIALAAVLYLNWNRRLATADRINHQTAKVDAWHELQTVSLAQGFALLLYYAFPNAVYAEDYRDTRARAQIALATLRAEVLSQEPADVAGVDQLAVEYEAISAQGEESLQALERGDIAGAVTIATSPVDLRTSVPLFQQKLDEAIAVERGQLALNESADRRAQRTSFWLAVSIVAIWSLVLLGLALAAIRWLVGPLERASIAAKALAAGDLTARVDEAGPRELARLGSDVNEMASALIHRSDELNAYLAKNLEGRTAELETRTEELQTSEQRFRGLVQHASDLITVIDADGTISYQSPSVERVLGRTPVELVGRKLTDLAHPDDVQRVASFITDATKLAVGGTTAAIRLSAQDGSWVHVEVVGTDHRDDPAIRGLVLNIRDVHERHALEEQLRFEASHDPLTHLSNRAQFTERLIHAIERSARRTTDLTVLFLDLDDFKSVNDSLGHSAGDALLVEVGGRLRACMRTEDTVARLGGDEFAILIEEVGGADEALLAARRTLDTLHAPVRLGGRDVVVPASIGVVIGDGESDAGILLHNADVAMYAAKALGKNRIKLYEPSMGARALDAA